MVLRICSVLLLVLSAVCWAAPSAAGRRPQLIRHVRPVYPPEAKQAGIEGMVELEAVIARDGTVRTVSVLEGEPVLADAAIAAVKQWEYKPVLHDGEPVEAITQITVNFVLAKWPPWWPPAAPSLRWPPPSPSVGRPGPPRASHGG